MELETQLYLFHPDLFELCALWNVEQAENVIDGLFSGFLCSSLIVLKIYVKICAFNLPSQMLCILYIYTCHWLSCLAGID